MATEPSTVEKHWKMATESPAVEKHWKIATEPSVVPMLKYHALTANRSRLQAPWNRAVARS